MKVFTSQNVGGLSFTRVVKRVIPDDVIQIEDEFQVPLFDGDVLQGKPGDYLVCDVKGNLSVCKQGEFEKQYRFYREDIDG
jgi:hypothetical protein